MSQNVPVSQDNDLTEDQANSLQQNQYQKSFTEINRDDMDENKSYL